MLNKIGGRKILAGLIILLCGIGALLLRGDVPAGFLTLLQTIFGAFVIGNIGEHVAGAIGPKAPDQTVVIPTQSVDLTEALTKLEKIDNDMNTLGQALGNTNESVATVQQAISYIIERAFPKKPS